MVPVMPAATPTFSQIRFAPAGLALTPPVFTTRTRGATDATDAPAGTSASLFLDMARAEGLALLDHLGLGQPDFGAIAARELAPLCRRRLWAVARNADPALRERTAQLLAVAEHAGEGMVLFG